MVFNVLLGGSCTRSTSPIDERIVRLLLNRTNDVHDLEGLSGSFGRQGLDQTQKNLAPGKTFPNASFNLYYVCCPNILIAVLVFLPSDSLSPPIHL